jgi:hypothetical protein
MVKKKFGALSEEFFWKEVMPQLLKAVFGGDLAVMAAWIGMSKVDKRIESLNTLIAISEVVPGIDLGLPPGVVLGAMYDKTDEALEMINELAQALRELPDNLKAFIQKVVDKAVEEVEEAIPDVPDLPDIPFAERQPEETWEEFIKRRLKETGLFKL